MANTWSYIKLIHSLSKKNIWSQFKMYTGLTCQLSKPNPWTFDIGTVTTRWLCYKEKAKLKFPGYGIFFTHILSQIYKGLQISNNSNMITATGKLVFMVANCKENVISLGECSEITNWLGIYYELHVKDQTRSFLMRCKLDFFLK